MDVICRYLDVSFLNDDALFQQYLSSLASKQRKEKAVSFRIKSARNLSLGASLLLEQMLRDEGITDYQLVYEPSGRPVLSSGSLQFSLSHSGTTAVCAMSSTPVGADVEQIKAIRVRGILRYFHPAEVSYIEQAEQEDLAFIRLWTRKESYGKRTGAGIGYDLKQYCFIENDDSDAEFKFHELLLPQHLITVCTARHETVLFEKAEIHL